MTDSLMTVWAVQRWTPEREELLVELWEANKPPPAIAARLGTSVSAVISKANILGLPRRSGEWTDGEIELLERLWDEGYTGGQIAKHFPGKSRSAIIGKVHRLGLASRKGPIEYLTPEQKLERRQAKDRARQVRWLKQRGPVLRPAKQKFEPPVWEGYLNLPLLDLDKDQCRYSPSADKPFLFCGQPVVDGESWCAHCIAVVFAQPVSKAARKPFIIRRAA